MTATTSRSYTLLLTAVVTVLGALASAAATPAIDGTGDDAESRRLEAAYRFALGKLYAEEADYEAARRALHQALELDDSDPYARLELARLYADLADNARGQEARFEALREAAGQAGQALRRAPENTDVLRLYGRVHLRLAEVEPTSLEEARKTFESLRRMVPGDLQVLISLGQIYLWRHDFSNAAEVLLEAASYRPRNRMINRMLLDALYGKRAFDEAEPTLLQMLELEPRAIEHRLALAEIYSGRGEHRKAVAVLEEAPEEMRGDPRLREALAIRLHRIGEDQRALELVDGLLAAGAGRGDSLTRLRISILSAQARYDEAIEAMAAWQPQDAATQVDRLLLLSRLRERVGRWQEAIDDLERALALAPPDDAPGLELRLIGTLERYGRREQAIERLKARLASAEGEELQLLVPTLAEIYRRDGRVEEGRRLLEQTIDRLAESDGEAADELRAQHLGFLISAEDWSAVAELAPALMRSGSAALQLVARSAHAEALAELGRIDEALALLAGDAGESPEVRRQLLARRVALAFEHDREAVARELIDGVAASDDPEELYFAAQLWQQGERYGEMIPLLERVLAAEPESTRALFSLAAAYERTGDVERAAGTFERLLELAPDHAPSLNYLGYMWADRGEHLERALRLIQRAVALDPDNGAYVDSLGWAHFRLGNLEQARQMLEWAARLIDDDPTIYEHLGDLYVALDQRERARQSYRQALELADVTDGSNEQLRHKLEQLGQGL
ncbi:MAG: hypothetical protein D6696_10985 [Acidobacteria bacterium]|nr:MAG: hypothetical protein D6696_10985 [Acidobacteriota bacterium]